MPLLKWNITIKETRKKFLSNKKRERNNGRRKKEEIDLRTLLLVQTLGEKYTKSFGNDTLRFEKDCNT